ncbi:MAG: LamG-like jellyroll fold domain-containing protein [Minisyncoccia bacterium]|jgi:prepilin-type N-terminal cleavage/methylation domain-containing protein
MPIKKQIFADKNDAGFTLIELLVVVAISAVLMTAGFLYLGGYRSEQNLKLSASELLATVKNTQALSKSQQSGMRWGMRFRNTTSSAGQSYTVFSGTSYAAGTPGQTYPVRRNISFSNPWASSTIDTIFNAVSGYPSQPQVISMTDGRQDGLVNDIIVNSLGQITSKFDTGLVGYWHLDEGTSTKAYDASGFSNTGTLNTPYSTWYSGSDCKIGGCLHLSDATNYVSIPNSSGLNIGGTAITVMAWANFDNFTNPSQTLVTKESYASSTSNSGYLLRFSSARPGFVIENNQVYSVYSPTSILPGIWYHVAGVYDGTVIRVYVNGTQTAITSYTGVIGQNSQSVYIGQQGWAPGKVNGYLDEIRVYNRALSATEISDIYNSTR